MQRGGFEGFHKGHTQIMCTQELVRNRIAMRSSGPLYSSGFVAELEVKQSHVWHRTLALQAHILNGRAWSPRDHL